MANHGPRNQGYHKDKQHPAGAERAYAPSMTFEKPFHCKDPSSFLQLPLFQVILLGLLGRPGFGAIR